MSRNHHRFGLLSIALVAGALSPALSAQTVPPTVRVTIPPLTQGEPFSGWITLYLMSQDAALPAAFTPADGPFLDDPQPMFSMFVENVCAGDVIEFKPTRGFPGPFEDLPAGKYRAQVVLDREQSHTSWLHEPSNLYTPIRWFEVSDRPEFVQFPLLNNAMNPLPSVPGVELYDIESPTMSAFFGRDSEIHVGVLFPRNYDPNREYAAVYLIPGFAMVREFGGDEREAFLFGAERLRKPEDHHQIWDDAFLITVSPQAKWGHSLFTDSPSNGPIETALLHDVIPALEERLPLVAKPEARLLMGHGAGGWASIWLQMNHPDVFGGAWATSPDPVDFRAFMNTDIYSAQNFFTDANGRARGFYRADGVVRATNQEAAAMEEIAGPNLTSGKQLAGWQAAFGPINGAGDGPARLYDPVSGAIDQGVAQASRKRDISDQLRARPDEFGPIFRDRIRIVVGDSDNFWLNSGVAMLAKELKTLGYTGGSGYIDQEADTDFGATETRSRGRTLNEMRSALDSAGLIGGSN